MEAQGFCLLKNKNNVNFKHAMGDSEEWLNKPLLALEINDSTKSVLLLKGVDMGMFDFSDVRSMFKCKKQGDFILPLGLNIMEEMHYTTLVMNRKGGYNTTVMHMIIVASLSKGEFTDSMLWSKDQHPAVVESIKRLKAVAKRRTELKNKYYAG